jgi:hypothetical protein
MPIEDGKARWPTKAELQKSIERFWQQFDDTDEHDADCTCSECLCVEAIADACEDLKK